VLRFDKSSVDISCEASSNPSPNISHVDLRAISANVNSNVISNNSLVSCQNSADSSFSSTISDITSESQQPNFPSQKPLSENTFRVLSSNVDCLTNKLLESEVLLREEAADIASFVELLPKHSFLAVTETSLQIPGYQLFSNLEHSNCRRGVGVYVRDGIQVSVVNPTMLDISLIESVWLDISIANKNLRLGCVYRSPSAPSLEDSELALKTIIDEMTSSISLPSSFELIITGDFNFPAIEWVEGTGHISSNSRDSPFLSCLSNNFLHQTIDKPTRYRADQNPSLLDLVILRDTDSLIRNDYLPPIASSDHLVILSVLSLNSRPQPKFRPQTFTDYEAIQQELSSANWSMLITSDINESWLNFKKTLLALEKKHSRVIFRKQPKTLPFLTKEVKKLINQKSRAWKRYMKKRNQETLSFYNSVRNRVTDSVKKTEICLRGKFGF